MRMWMWGWSLAQLNCHLRVDWNVAIPGDWWMNFTQQRTAHSELLIRSENKSYNITRQGGTAASAALLWLTGWAGPPVCLAPGAFPGLKVVFLPMLWDVLQRQWGVTQQLINTGSGWAWKHLYGFVWLKDADFPHNSCFSRWQLHVCLLERDWLEPQQSKAKRQCGM